MLLLVFAGMPHSLKILVALLRYKPLEGTAEHVSTLDELCTWVLTHVEARAAQAARREEVRRRQEEERRQLEADPVWQEQQREAARKRKQAEEAAAAARAERERIAAQRAAEAKKAEWEAKARSLAAKVQSRLGTPGAPGSSAAEINGQAPEAACGAEQVTTEQPSEPAFQLASCQSCGNHLRFCSDKGCTILLHGTCGCRESSMHPNLTKCVKVMPENMIPKAKGSLSALQHSVVQLAWKIVVSCC
jgi:signal transduction histidine kinase